MCELVGLTSFTDGALSLPRTNISRTFCSTSFADVTKAMVAV